MRTPDDIAAEIEREIEWTLHHSEAACQHLGPRRLRYHTRERLRVLIPRLQALLDEAEANYRREYGEAA